MKLSKSAVCNICVFNQEGECQAGYISAPATKEECWQFRHKQDKLNLARRSGEDTGYRLDGVFKY